MKELPLWPFLAFRTVVESASCTESISETTPCNQLNRPTSGTDDPRASKSGLNKPQVPRAAQEKPLHPPSGTSARPSVYVAPVSLTEHFPGAGWSNRLRQFRSMNLFFTSMLLCGSRRRLANLGRDRQHYWDRH